MSPRSIRRAAERKAEKEVRKALRTQPNPEPVAEPAHDPNDELDWTPEPIATPRHYATGPRTSEGKRIASLNAVKTGLTGRTVLLPSDDADAYRQHIAAYEAEYKPVGLRETELVQSMADTQWRLQRIPGLESAIYARGRHEFAEAHAAAEPTLRRALIDLDTHLKYEKQLRNLQLQESRLTRRYEKESAELRQLQKERTATRAATAKVQTQAAPAHEFVFSNSPTAAFQQAPGLEATFAPQGEAA